MRKSGFIKALSDECGLSQRDVEKVVDAMSPVIVKACVEDGEEISLPIGKFKQRVNKEKTARNPVNGEPVLVPASTTLGFKASKTVKIVEEKKAAKGKKK